MQEDTLTRVLEAENAIAERVKAAEEETGQWLAEQKKGIERRKEAELDKLEESRQADMKEAEKDAEQKVAAMVTDGAELQRLLSTLGDQPLKRIVARYLVRIRPGKSDDSQDVEN